MARHKHADLIHAWAEGAEIEVLAAVEEWRTTRLPSWLHTSTYRVKPEPDPYAELKAAHAAGKTIQMNCGGPTRDDWRDQRTPPTWRIPANRYRVKPEEPVDPYAELKAAHAAGKTIQMKATYGEEWCDMHNYSPAWDDPPASYRVKPHSSTRLQDNQVVG